GDDRERTVSSAAAGITGSRGGRRIVAVVWRIRLLGGLRVEGADRTVSTLGYQTVNLLLAYLAYHSHAAHSREELVELLWPGSLWEKGQRARARTNFRKALSDLRHALEPAGSA